MLTWYRDSGDSCASGEAEVARVNNGACGWFSSGQRLCCKANPTPPLDKCHWVGRGDCADNTCNSHEVTVITDPVGEGGLECNCGYPLFSPSRLTPATNRPSSLVKGYRRKSLCCTPNRDISEFICHEDKYCSLYSCPPDLYEGPNPPDDDDTFAKRDLVEAGHEHDPRGLLEKRGEQRRLNARIWDALNGVFTVWQLYARLYPGPARLYSGTNGGGAYGNAIRQVSNPNHCRSLR